MKPGDTVWIKDLALADPEGGHEWGIRSNAAMTGEEYVSGVADGWFIPDHPLLPAVANWLATIDPAKWALLINAARDAREHCSGGAFWEVWDTLVKALEAGPFERPGTVPDSIGGGCR